jgi:hypothetical protein
MEKQMEATLTKFNMGFVYETPGASAAFEQANENSMLYLLRHAIGDWGDVCEEDRLENEFAVESDLRIFSVYKLCNGAKVWIITEADRSVTTILLPEEY